MTLITPGILIVDDEDIVRKSCVRILSPYGYNLQTARNGSEAVKKLQNEAFDLVLADLVMPDTTGIDLLKKIKEEWPETEVIIITGYGTVKTAVDALKYGAYDFIEKPFTPEVLLNSVERCLEKKRLKIENIRLRQEINALYSLDNIIGTSREMQKVFKLIATVSSTGSTVLITGESGTGKELVARAIHYNSARKEQPFIVVDCGTIPENLMESELFGHIKGSFTSAVTTEKGVLETANGGTVFLDEISNLPLSMQMKLLRVLQEKEFRPVGSKKIVKIDIRFIAATNRDLSEMVKQGKFREDFFYRLNVFPINVPPLRNRKEDIPALAYYFLHKYSKEVGRDVPHISAEAMRQLIANDWPGNVRELENVIHRAVIVCEGRMLRPEHIMIPIGYEEEIEIPMTLDELKLKKKNIRTKSIEEIEKGFLIAALRRNDWNITRAAAEVGMQRPNFHALLKKYNISKGKSD
ncbi:Fis family transcriptional regulator [Dissulfurispira thermophila]|uniref:Fis family transcriptional regulator n=2 Tax=root TaxID=1 RepID=A0A7G1H385_9BACT|nr:sigma-54 dependent transcriptional regulator [Dissulfurispira thermophila]BCB97275.1 Fis family transcriptional regulator [Dissulfurispira thermophila]